MHRPITAASALGVGRGDLDRHDMRPEAGRRRLRRGDEARRDEARRDEARRDACRRARPAA
ncbi:hypothetical protein AB0I52_30485 [Streptomyces sp. NPDC050423]|uniref:hypothetical protein n=1 Tax=Streptomyces sp. NPDC050423 TaxID=3155402 RepID=UPI00343A1207